MPADVILILAGALAGGFANGLTGFGTGLTALPFWLYALSPPAAAQLAAAAGVVGQLQTLPKIWRTIPWKSVAVFIVPGLIGVPLGTLILPHVSLPHFKLGIGILLTVYSLFMLIANGRVRITGGGRIADALVGLSAGILGGLAGVSGALPTVWATLKAYSKDYKRALFQSFNFTILAVMLISSAAAGLSTWEFWRALLISLPATIAGSRFGHWLYVRLDERRFDHIVLGLLALSGISLVTLNIGAFWPS